MDGIFGPDEFQMRLSGRGRASQKAQSNYFGKTHDVVLLYTKTNAAPPTNPQFVELPERLQEEPLQTLLNPGSERRYGLWDFTQKALAHA